ncbi:MAG: AFG1 family ATPase [Alphaproteobacteria bacterium]|nr:AFG1 family ATPase [Alphaproteobacteria bacterium]
MNPLSNYTMYVANRKIDPDPQQARAVESLNRLHRDVVEYESQRQEKGWRKHLKFLQPRHLPPRGIYLFGPVGRGKSMLMDLFYDTLPLNIKKRRIHFHQFMIEVQDYLHLCRVSGVGMEESNIALLSLAIVVANRSRVLCFDEFHVTDVADAMILSRLFTALLDQGICIVATSNWAPKDLYKGGLQRDRFMPFINLIEQRMEVVEIDSPHDYRARDVKNMSFYFSPLGAEAGQNADNLFNSLTHNAPVHTDLLTVRGRSIQVPVVAQDVARFGFSQLCERPLGAEDYMAIARRYHTVFLENIPHLGYDRRNEAYRLMTLVDVMYDQHRSLVITAQSPPQNLYSGHDHAFEFQRTVSRLLEMQTHEYMRRVQAHFAPPPAS